MITFKTSLAGILSLLLCSIGLSAPPSPPQNIQQAWLTTESLLLWDETPGATSYNVYRADETNTTWTLVGSSAVPRFRDPTLQFLPSFYVVTSVNADGESTGSEASTVAFAEGYTISVYEPQQWQGTLSPTNALLQLVTSDPNGGQGLIDWGLDPTNFTWFAMDTNYLAYQWFYLTNLSPRTFYFYRLTSITSNRAGVSYLGYFQTPDTNHPPVAEDFTAWWPVPTNGGWILLRGYDSNEPSQSLTFRIVSLPTNGTLSEIQSGWSWNEASVVYTPVPGARGYDYFRFVVNNGTWDSAPGLVTLTNWYNTPPATTNGLLTAPEDTPLAFTIPNFDAEGDPVTFDISPWAVWNGTISGTPPNLVFTPATNFNGTTWFSYQVSDGYEQVWGWYQIDVTPVNDKPVIMTNFLIGASTWEDYPTTLWLPIFDVEWNSTYELIVVTPPLHGAISGDAWNVIYTPETNFFGTDYFTIAVREPDGTTSDPVTLPIQVQSMDDAPVAFNQNVTVFEDTPQVIVPTGFDVEGDPLTFQVAQYPNNGWVEQNGTNFIYHPMTNFIGQDAFSFWAVDSIGLWSWDPAWIQIQVVDANDAPIASYTHHNLHTDIIVARPFNVTDLDGDTMTCEVVQPPLQGTVTIDGTNFTYTPGPGLFDYEDSFTYHVSDGLAYGNEALVTLWIGQTNSLPVAQDQSVDTIRNQTLSFQLSIQDANGEEIPLGLLEAAPTNGMVELTTNGYAIYIPAPEFIGTDTFTYRPYDGFATGNLATVTISVTPQNRPPTGPTLYFSTTEDTSKALDVSMTDPDGDALTYSTVISASHGSLVGTFPFVTYVPNTNFSGTDYILYWAFDGQAHSLQTWIIIDVSPVNDAPVANPGSVTVAEDNSVAILLTGSDVDGDALTVIIQTNPSHGTLTNQSGTFRYFPATNFNGSDSFVFRVSDGSLQSADATVSITVTPVNDAPVRLSPDRGFTISEDWYREFDTQASDADGDVLTYRIVTQPSHGTVTKLTSNTWRYQPAWNWYGDDLLTWVASDGQVDCAIGTVWFHVVSENDRPLTGYDSLTNAEDTAFAVTLWASDVEGSPLTYTIITPPTNGVLSGSGSNRIYTPNPNFVGGDSLTYKVNDGQLDSSFPGTILFTVTNVNDAPIANSSSRITPEDAAVSITLTGSDIDGDALTFTVVNGPANGTLSGAAPNLVYTPNANFFGGDAFTFAVSDGVTSSAPATVSITVTAVEAAPVANAISVTTAEDTAANITLTSSDVDNDPLSFAIVSGPTHGSLTGTAPNLVYTPASDYFGSDSFVFSVSDGITNSTATVSITVTAVNDLSIASGLRRRILDGVVQLWWNAVPGAASYNVYRADETNGVYALVASGLAATNYSDAGALFQHTYHYYITTSDGAAESNPSNPVLARPDDTGLITLNVESWIIRALTAQVQFCSDLNSGVEGLWEYGTTTNYDAVLENTNLLGCQHFTLSNLTPQTVYYYRLTATDSNGNAIVYWNSFVTDGAPVADAQSVSTAEDNALDITVFGHNANYGPYLLTYSIASGVSHGTLTSTGPNTFRYTPATNYDGADSFTFKVNNGELDSAPATVSVTVTPVNDAPVAANITRTAAEDIIATIPASFTDVDGGTLVFVEIVSQPAHGSAGVSGTNLMYLPATNYFGADSFTYRISDGFGFGNTATVSITVTNVEDSPIAFAQSVTTAEDVNKAITLAGVDPDGDSITFSIYASPARGTLVGTPPNVTYRPATNYNGADSFAFRVYDGKSFSVPATVTVTVTPVNDAPVASAQSVTVGEDASLPIALSATDADGDTLTYSILAQPTHGVLSGTLPNVTYQPDANYNGPDSFTFRVTDGNTFSAAATVSITVSAVNDAPVVANRTFSTDEDTPLNFTLGGSDVDGDALTMRIISTPNYGTISGTGPSFTYTPNANFNGTDAFFYTANDGSVDGNTASVIITVTAVNDAPIASAQSVTTPEDTAASITLNATDVEGSTLTYSVATGPAHGALSGTGRNLVYTPAANYNGPDSFTFVANDGAADSAAAAVSITVTAVNDRPVANNDTVTLAEDTAANITLTGTDVEGGSLTFTVWSYPQNGTITGAAPNLVYTPDANFNGTNSLQFIVSDGSLLATGVVTIIVTPVNDAPVVTDRSYTVNEDWILSAGVITTDIDGDPLTYRVVTAPLGSLTFSNNGSFTYRGPTNYNGTDSFTFVANDGTIDGNIGTVTITLIPQNDMPYVTNQTVATPEDTSVAITPLAGDVDGDPLTFTVFTNPGQGSVSWNGSQFIYTPATNYHGADSFQYQANDPNGGVNTALVTIDVQSVNDAPVAQNRTVSTTEDNAVAVSLIGSDADGDALTYRVIDGPANGTLSGTAPNLVYTPNANFNGSDSFTYTVNDGTTDGNTATASISVSAVNDAPVAAAQSVTLSEDGSLAITLSGSDVENSPLTFAIVGGPAHGTLSGSAPNVVYTPAENYNGPDSFTFRVNDGTTNSAPAAVSITVSAINDAPSAYGQTVATAEDSSVAITLSGSDVDGDALSFAIVSAPTHGTLSGTAPNLTYTPAANYNGADSFTFRVGDGATNSTVATVNINVTAVNDAPTANGQSVTVAYNTATGITLTGSDVEGSPLTYTIVNGPTNGTLSGTAPNLTYTPNAGSVGADFFTFRVNDGAANSPVATVSITTQNPGSIPAAPSSLVVTVPTATGTLNLSWNDNSTNEDGFKIERSPNGNNSWAQIATVGINVHAYTNSGLSSNTRYYYRVRAYNLLGNSAYSNTANGKTR